MVQKVTDIKFVTRDNKEHAVLYKTAICLYFYSTIFICSLHVKFSSMITSMNFVCDTCSMFVPFKPIFTCPPVFLFVQIVKCALFTCSDNLITLNHRSRFPSLLLTTCITSYMLLAE